MTDAGLLLLVRSGHLVRAGGGDRVREDAQVRVAKRYVVRQPAQCPRMGSSARRDGDRLRGFSQQRRFSRSRHMRRSVAQLNRRRGGIDCDRGSRPPSQRSLAPPLNQRGFIHCRENAESTASTLRRLIRRAHRSLRTRSASASRTNEHKRSNCNQPRSSNRYGEHGEDEDCTISRIVSRLRSHQGGRSLQAALGLAEIAQANAEVSSATWTCASSRTRSPRSARRR